MNIDILPWLLVIQLWTEPPPKIQLLYKKEFPTYAECMAARKEWEQKKLVALCVLNNPK